MNTDTLQMTPAKVIDTINRFMAAVEEDRRAKLVDVLQPMVERLSMGLFRIVVLGEIKKGKTSFISALLGMHDVLPTDTGIATSTAYKIIYGPKPRFTVFFLPDAEGNTPAPEIIEKDAIFEYGSESGNPDNRKNVDFIGVELPAPLLKDGIALIDTPGLGGLCRKHREITYRYLPNADAVFFVLDSTEAVISQDELDVIKETCKITKQICFIQTKTDKVADAQVKIWRNRNLDEISKAMSTQKEEIPYFLVSNKDKRNADLSTRMTSSDDFQDRMEDLRGSGFSAIYRFLNERLLPSKDDILSRSAMMRIGNYISAEGSRLQDRVRIVREAGKESLFSLETELAATIERLKNWQQSTFREEERRVKAQIEDLNREYRYKIQETLDPNGTTVGEYFDGAKRKFTDAQQVSKEAKDTLSRFAGYCTDTAKVILSDYQKGVHDILKMALRQSVASLVQEVGIDAPPVDNAYIRGGGGYLDDDAIKNGIIQGSMAGTLTLGMFSMYFGGNVGAAILAIGLGGLNPVGWAVVGTIVAAGAFAGVHGYRKTKTQKLDIAIRDLQGYFTKIAHSAQRLTTKEFDAMSRDLERQAYIGMERLYTETMEHLNGKINEVRKTKERTNAENQAVLQQLSQSLSILVDLDRSIGKLK